MSLEDDAAFEEWWEGATQELRRAGRRSPYYAESLSRQAYNAGMKRGHACGAEHAKLIKRQEENGDE